ncbi:uroporphyrinogen-III synthase [Pseudomonas saudimassiliensis]|uniref:Uroporphyrinogen-III synthase n=1 Tax=Pseudomonas saudimassiliensis TaxID=1461581 RepID=A0A078M9T8_9PSED|nr:uroporphyrinogen-III synthase [Pseudomonas saudimassiliensis]CEA04163.1 uroporphyrinogen-III synthase [Pseudomonas saudimassiliensis]CEF26452.1 uroporphyrinogen-III synthase [Pseudomonas saudimassiliensis]
MSTAVLLTRSDADNQRLAERLQAQGIRALSLPLLQIDPQPETGAQRSLMLDLDRYHAVMVVSPIAARLGLERLDALWPQAPVGIEWFAVGAGTAAVLEDYGLPVQIPVDGQDSEALLRLPAWQRLLAQPDLRVLIWRGVGGRDHLASTVRAAGGQVDLLELYQRNMPATLAQDLAAAAEQGAGAIVILSGQALQHWQRAAGTTWEQQRHWRCWVPGMRVAELARELGCTDVIACQGADDDSVLAAVMAHPLTP